MVKVENEEMEVEEEVVKVVGGRRGKRKRRW